MYKISKHYLFTCITMLAFFGNAQSIDTNLLKNLTPEQISMVQSQLGNSQTIDPNFIQDLTPEQIRMAKFQLNEEITIGEPATKISESTIERPITDINKTSDKKYGYDFFSSVPTTITAVGDLPIPNDYKISLNDQLTVILSGSKEAIFDLNVNLDGTILFPELGSVYVAGETFNDVKSKLRNLINQSYIGVQIDLSLKNLSAKKITIVGAVKAPGTYLVNPFSTISGALAYSGGISDIGTLRNIKLIRNNGDMFNFDLYELLIMGDRSADITIEAGDVILINPANQFIKISGEVKRPAIYEVTESEILDDLVKFALGFTDFANELNISLDVLDITSAAINSINTSKLSFDLDNVLSVEVFGFLNKDNASIRVRGAVNKPGYYPLQENLTLEMLINNLEFVDVYPWLGVLEQFDDNNLIKSTILFSLKDPTTYESIQLLPNSKVYFANIFTREFDVESTTQRKIEDYELNINHKEVSYKLPLYGKYQVLSFVELLGLDMSDVNNDATYISPLDNTVIKDDYRKMQFTAKKYNTVTFQSPINDLIKVSIKGQVDYPGTYTLESDATLQDLYEMIGNFKKEAFLEGIIFTRESVRDRQLQSIKKSNDLLDEALLSSIEKGDEIGDVNMIRALSKDIEPENMGRIAGDFSPNSASAFNTILFNGDEIIIPKKPYTINVLGQVLNPTSIEYKKGIRIIEAINGAGGYKENAKKSSIYIIKANGITQKVRRNIFVNNINLDPGDSIVVPRKIITNNQGIAALVPVTQLLSDLAFSAAAIESLSNSN